MKCNCNCNSNEDTDTITIHVSANHATNSNIEMVYTMSSPITLDELFNNFRAIALGLTYSQASWDRVVVGAADSVHTIDSVDAINTMTTATIDDVSNALIRAKSLLLVLLGGRALTPAAERPIHEAIREIDFAQNSLLRDLAQEGRDR